LAVEIQALNSSKNGKLSSKSSPKLSPENYFEKAYRVHKSINNCMRGGQFPANGILMPPAPLKNYPFSLFSFPSKRNLQLKADALTLKQFIYKKY
jgi:hypothetical protein